MDSFNAYSEFYDLINSDKDYRLETQYIVDMLRGLDINSGDIIEFGSGTGKHAGLLSTFGYQIRGIELSQAMIAMANKSEGVSFTQGDISTVSLGYKADLVLSLFHVMSYQIENRTFSEAVRNAGRHLKDTKHFIFDFWYSPAVLKQKPSVRIKRAQNDYWDLLRIAEPEIVSTKNCVNVHYTFFARNLETNIIRCFKETHMMRHLSLPEIDWIASDSGFRRIRAEEFLTGEIPSEDTWSVCVVLEKV